MTQLKHPILDAALHYATLYGWHVHPVNRNKRPITENGFYDATIDESTIRTYFKNGAQLSVRTGEASGLFVLDLDHDPVKGYDVAQTLLELTQRFGPLPKTPHQRTGRGGLQYFFRYQEGLRNKAGSLVGPGVDTRGEGGYVVVAPSANSYGRYEWIVSPDEAPLADVPVWLLDLMTAKQAKPQPQQMTQAKQQAAPRRDYTAYLASALANEIALVRNAPDGTKHVTLRDAAIKLGTLIDHGLDEAHIEQALYDAIVERDIEDPNNALKTIQDGIAYGKARPRDIPERISATHSNAPDVDNRPTIDVSTIDLPTIMPQAWEALLTLNDPPTIFRRAGDLVRLEVTETGSKVIHTVDARRMLGALARAARWVRVSYARGGTAIEKETTPPVAVIDDCMVNIDPHIPVLSRIVHAPTFADDGSLLTNPGYHPGAQVYYDPRAQLNIPPVPTTPTAADLDKARSLILDDLLVDFPFVSEADRAHAVALYLLPFVRDLIDGPTPLHLIEAPTMGSGKSLLAETLLLPALGDVPAALAEASTDEEWGKVITSNLLAAPAVIYIDNLNRMLASGKLAAVLTAREFSDRVLGKSEQVHLPVRCAWVATANNPTMSTEISRRCIRIRIDPRVDRPWQRDGFRHPKLRSWIIENRGELIWAALVLCRYGMASGNGGQVLGSYESWSDIIGRILDGTNIQGFLGNLDQLYDRADAEGAAWRALVAAWWEKHQDNPTSVSDLFPVVSEVEADLLISGKDDTGRKKSFGKALTRVLDRVFSIDAPNTPGRVQVADAGVRHKTRQWKLVPTEGGGIGGLGGFLEPTHVEDISLPISLYKTPNTPQTPTVTNEIDERQTIAYSPIVQPAPPPPAYRVIPAPKRNISHESLLAATERLLDDEEGDGDAMA